jgi:hypothetical protein
VGVFASDALIDVTPLQCAGAMPPHVGVRDVASHQALAVLAVVRDQQQVRRLIHNAFSALDNSTS